MLSRTQELNNLMQQKDISGVIKFIKESINNGNITELKNCLILSRYFSSAPTANIVQYSVMMSAYKLFDFLKENVHLLPANYFKANILVEWAVNYKNHYVARSYIKNAKADIDIDKCLFAAATGNDKTMVKLLLNHGAKLTDKYENAITQNAKFEAQIKDEEKSVKDFQYNLFTFFAGSRYDQNSHIFKYQTPADCINVVHDLGF